MGFVNVEKRNRIAVISINNLPLNIISLEVATELAKCLEELENDNDTSCVILSSASEKAFMAGADIKEFVEKINNPDAPLTLIAKANQAINILEDLSKPTIAAIHGLALGGGLEIALGCDIRIADNSATFALPEIKLGLFPGAGGTQRLTRLIGKSKTKELIFTGESISAEQALSIGIIDKLVPNGQALYAAQEMAELISTRSSTAVFAAKKSINEGIKMNLKKGLELEAALFANLFSEQNTKEGISAFLEKRKANFS